MYQITIDATRHPFYGNASEDEPCDDAIDTIGLTEHVRHVLPRMDSRMQYHVGQCDKCRHNASLTVGQALACMSRNSWIRQALLARGE